MSHILHFFFLEASLSLKNSLIFNFHYKATLSVRINGATVLVADIDEVDDIVNMWTVPRRGQAAAQGQIRAITVITADDQKDFEVEPRRKKTLQGQLEQLRMPLRNHPFAL